MVCFNILINIVNAISRLCFCYVFKPKSLYLCKIFFYQWKLTLSADNTFTATKKKARA